MGSSLSRRHQISDSLFFGSVRGRVWTLAGHVIPRDVRRNLSIPVSNANAVRPYYRALTVTEYEIQPVLSLSKVPCAGKLHTFYTVTTGSLFRLLGFRPHLLSPVDERDRPNWDSKWDRDECRR